MLHERVVETAVSGGDGGSGGQKWNVSRGEMGRGRREKKRSRTVLKFSYVRRCHVTDEHKRTAPHVPCPLTFVGLPRHQQT
jgi:hypothetical protein